MRIPEKLKCNDEIRIIAPSRSLKLISEECRDYANRCFDEMGLKVTFSKNCEISDDFMSSSIEDRIADLHEAFADKNVKCILTVIGGYNSNQLLKYIDYDLIKDRPSNIHLVLETIKRQIDRDNIEDYILIIGDSVAYSSPGKDNQSIGYYMEDQFKTTNKDIHVFNLSLPSNQTGDIYTILLMLDQYNISNVKIFEFSKIHSYHYPFTPKKCNE